MNPDVPHGLDDPRERMLLYLDGTLPADEVERLNARLRSDTARRGEFAEMVLQQVQLTELDHAKKGAAPLHERIVQLPIEAGESKMRKPPRRWIVPLAWAASIALLLVLNAWFFGPTTGEPILAKIEANEVSIRRGGDSVPATIGLHLQPGDVLRTGTNDAATLNFGPENTGLLLSASTKLRVASFTHGKRLELHEGKLEASVARQRPFRPMIIATPQAEARVLGTKFTLTTTANSTRLDVSEGNVRLTRTSDGARVDVPKEYSAIAAANVYLAALPKTGGILREYWTNILGDHPGQLAREPAFPDRPNGSEMLNSFEVPSNWGDHFGDRIRGFIHPPLTGAYVFWISADADSTLTLSRTEKPEDRTQIAVADGGPPQDWDRHIAQRSNPLTLEAGRRYYLEVIRKTDTGLDHLAVAWQPPGGQREIIPAEFLSPVETKKGRR